jgi:hypothetical protein
MAEALTASKAAYKFTHVLNRFAEFHGTDRFPVDVVALAKDAANQFNWNDPITEVQAADIKGFEGALFPDDDKRKWLLLYNHKLKSPGRIRFTQAHELGHYLLHRQQQDSFSCSSKDLINLDTDEKTIEAQADSFASTLLMPLDDFRIQMDGTIDFESLGACADRYGVSLTAAALRWLKDTDKQAVLIVHRDGYVDWAFSSRPALKNGAFFRSRQLPVDIPPGSLAANETVTHDRAGTEIRASTWFPHAPVDLPLREMKITADGYDSIMTLLVLPRGASVWQPWEARDPSSEPPRHRP